MKNRIKKPGLAASFAAGTALGLAAAAGISAHPGTGLDSHGRVFIFDSSFSSDTLSPSGGSGMGGSNGTGDGATGADPSFGRDSSPVLPGDTSSGYPYSNPSPGGTAPGGSQ